MPETLHAPWRAGGAEPSADRVVALDRDRREVPAADTLRILVAEGLGLVRAGLRVLLEAQPGMCVAAEAATAPEAVAAARDVRPDIVLIDSDLPGGGGLDASRQIVAQADGAGTRVVMLIGSHAEDAVFDALRAGATGLLLRDAHADDLVQAVRVVAAGDVLLPPRLARTVVADFLSRPERLHSTPEELEELTPREREVVALVACGLSNEEIAEQLVVTRATAKTHVSRALCKLHARDRAQLVVLAYEAGLVRPGPHRLGSGQPVPLTRFGAGASPSPARPGVRSVAA
jgi:DNA-binding NarL/FixJ family response regulator